MTIVAILAAAYLKTVKPKPPTYPRATEEVVRQDEQATAIARRKFEEDMAAFQELMNYTADTAYGIQPKE